MCSSGSTPARLRAFLGAARHPGLRRGRILEVSAAVWTRAGKEGVFRVAPLPGPSWELPGGRPSRGAAEAQICEVLCTEGGTENMGLCVGGTVEHKESPCLQAKDISQLRF